MRVFSLFLGTLLLAAQACGTTSAVPSSPETENASPPVGNSEHTLMVGPLERSYVLHIPPTYDFSHPTPIVLAFHGITLDAYEMIRISGLNIQSDAAGFIVVYPNAYGRQRSWNGGHCCGEAARENTDDVGFARALLDELDTYLNIDHNRIYATGFSNGAILTYRLGCEMADQIAAIAPVSATQAQEDIQACHPSRPLPVLHFHGMDDEPNPYNGGVTPGGVQFISVSDQIAFWVSANGCPTQAKQTTSGSIVHNVYAPCQDGAAVELYTIIGGKHAWPGGEAVSLRMGQPTMEISATPLMWEFFIAHPMP